MNEEITSDVTASASLEDANFQSGDASAENGFDLIDDGNVGQDIVPDTTQDVEIEHSNPETFGGHDADENGESFSSQLQGEVPESGKSIDGENGGNSDVDPSQPDESGNQPEEDSDQSTENSDAREGGSGKSPSFRGNMKHLYCPRCGHEWYSPNWDSYCPKSGCLGRPKPM